MKHSASNAPAGSESPDAVAMRSAWRRLPVAAYTGAATMMPSGTLWTPMAAAITGPMSVKDENATANPSGRLCSVMVMAISIPSRISLALDTFDSPSPKPPLSSSHCDDPRSAPLLPPPLLAPPPAAPPCACPLLPPSSSTGSLGSSGSSSMYSAAPAPVASVTPTNPFSITFLTYSSTTLSVAITPMAVPSRKASSLLSGFFHTAMRPPTLVASPAIRDSPSAYQSASSNMAPLFFGALDRDNEKNAVAAHRVTNSNGATRGEERAAAAAGGWCLRRNLRTLEARTARQPGVVRLLSVEGGNSVWCDLVVLIHGFTISLLVSESHVLQKCTGDRGRGGRTRTNAVSSVR
mmetsp:Transcript_40035/g.99066  ORF Transcript_40035/g.99066 Transcript_40035/m.99066 type:complete len:350 (+) Transcript_40035:240-1289(+)